MTECSPQLVYGRPSTVSTLLVSTSLTVIDSTADVTLDTSVTPACSQASPGSLPVRIHVGPAALFPQVWR